MNSFCNQKWFLLTINDQIFLLKDAIGHAVQKSFSNVMIVLGMTVYQ